MVQSFRDLVVWQKAIKLTVRVYELTREFPREEIYGLTSQMRRSAVLIPSNIAEGTGRSRTPELRHFLSIARASNCESQTQLTIARELNFGDAGRLSAAEELSDEVGKMIFVMIGRLSKRIDLAT
jgi:four helix bundle protein